MSASRRQPQQTILFDLDVAEEEPPIAEAAALAEDDELALELREVEADDVPPPARASELAPLRARVTAAAIDLVCHLAVAAAGAMGAVMLGVPPEPQALPGLVLLVVVFSLFFLVVPLAFWGRTAGMAAARIACRAAGDQPPTFGEAGRRWLGSLLTIAAAGLPALLVLGGGRSLADRLSGTVLVAD